MSTSVQNRVGYCKRYLHHRYLLPSMLWTAGTTVHTEHSSPLILFLPNMSCSVVNCLGRTPNRSGQQNNVPELCYHWNSIPPSVILSWIIPLQTLPHPCTPAPSIRKYGSAYEAWTDKIQQQTTGKSKPKLVSGPIVSKLIHQSIAKRHQFENCDYYKLLYGR